MMIVTILLFVPLGIELFLHIALPSLSDLSFFHVWGSQKFLDSFPNFYVQEPKLVPQFLAAILILLCNCKAIDARLMVGLNCSLGAVYYRF